MRPGGDARELAAKRKRALDRLASLKRGRPPAGRKPGERVKAYPQLAIRVPPHVRDMLRDMRKGSVVVDVAIDQGGCFETSRPTTHTDPIYFEEGVLHYCVANIPGIVPRTSTQALTNATMPYLLLLASSGVEAAIRADAGLAKGVNLAQGKVTCRGVAEAHGLRFDPLM